MTDVWIRFVFSQPNDHIFMFASQIFLPGFKQRLFQAFGSEPELLSIISVGRLALKFLSKK